MSKSENQKGLGGFFRTMKLELELAISNEDYARSKEMTKLIESKQKKIEENEYRVWSTVAARAESLAAEKE